AQTQATEHEAQRAAAEARSRAAAGQAAAQRFEALEADLAGARAAESQSRARVEELAARSQQAPVAAVAEADRTAVEVYLLSRIAAQRDVGQAGSLPLVVDDAADGLGPALRQAV